MEHCESAVNYCLSAEPINNNLYYNITMGNKLREKLTELKIGKKRNGIIATYDTRFGTTDEFLNAVARYISEGAEIVELSNKNLTDNKLLDCGKKIKQLCEMFGATFLIRNRADIAYLTSADGVNLEQDSIDIHSVREIVGEECIIGLYINDREGLFKSVKDGADYISVGNIISTPTEPVTSTGLEYAKWVSENNLLPVLVCGELTESQIKQLKIAGATRFLINKP